MESRAQRCEKKQDGGRGPAPVLMLRGGRPCGGAAIPGSAHPRAPANVRGSRAAPPNHLLVTARPVFPEAAGKTAASAGTRFARGFQATVPGGRRGGGSGPGSA